MKIYFAGSIRGGRDDKELYLQLIEHLSRYGQVLTEHIGEKNLTEFGETVLTDAGIYTRDMAWLKEADVVIAEVSTPSLGVGYEISKAEDMNKKMLCLYRTEPNKRLSAMIGGNAKMQIANYATFDDAVNHIEKFFNQL